MFEMTVLGHKLMFKRMPTRTALVCEKVCVVKNFTFALVEHVSKPHDVSVIHTDFYTQLHRRKRCIKKLSPERVIGSIGATALARLGIVDRRLDGNAGLRDQWEQHRAAYLADKPGCTLEAAAYANARLNLVLANDDE